MKTYPVNVALWLAALKSSDNSTECVAPAANTPVVDNPTPGVTVLPVVRENMVPAPVLVRG